MTPVQWTVNSNPPWALTLLNALQHVALSAVTLIFPRLVADAAGADAQTTTRYVSLAMVAMGIATLIQVWGRRGIGSGYLLLGHCTILYLPFAAAAAASGGLGAVAGMTIVAGLTEMALSRGVRPLRRWISPEVVGVVILLLGITLGMMGLRLVLGNGLLGPAGEFEVAASFVALVTIFAVSVWGSAALKPLAVLVGVGAGCAAYVGLQLAAGDPRAAAREIAWIGLQWPLALPSVTLDYLPGFLIGAVACFVRATADLSAWQQLENPKRQTLDFRMIRAGTLGDGLGTVVSGCLGVIGSNTYSGSFGLAMASGVHSRAVGLAAGAMWIMLGLTPGMASVVVAIPAGILGAAVLFSALFTIKTGITMIARRLIDTRRTLVIGIPVVISVLIPELQSHIELTTLGNQLMQSALAVAMLVAIALNAVLRLGISRDSSLTWRPSDGPAALMQFVDTAYGEWAVSVELARRARNLVEEFAGFAGALLPADAAVDFTQRFDETGIRIEVSWRGKSTDSAGARDAIPEEQDGGLELKLMRHWADELRIERSGAQQRLIAFVDEP